MFYELLINVKPDIANMLEEIPQEFVSKETTGSCYLWFDIKNTENISTKEELFEIFSEYLKIFDSAIDLIFFHNFKQPKEVKNNTIFFARSFHFPHFIRYIRLYEQKRKQYLPHKAGRGASLHRRLYVLPRDEKPRPLQRSHRAASWYQGRAD